MPSTTFLALTPYEIDELIYLTRTSDLEPLKSEVDSLATSHRCSPQTVLEAAIDEDSGCCLLHYVGANGDKKVLTYLLALLSTIHPTSTSPSPSPLLNHKNIRGNTALHWTALNHHLACIELLVSAGADPSIVNAAGHDAIFEAERAIGGEEEGEKAERGGKCVEWLLGCREAGVLEKGVSGREAETEGEAKEEDTEMQDGVS